MYRALIVAGVGYTGYFIIDAKVKLYYIESDLISTLLPKCPSLVGTFYPTPWLFNGVIQGIYGGYLEKRVKVPVNIDYTREYIRMEDGGVVSIDWKSPEDAKKSTKILLIIPGLTGTSKSAYITCAVVEGVKSGYRVGVIHGRGIGDTPLKVFHS
jgi:predicted alpha/beta-fold hydrolase